MKCPMMVPAVMVFLFVFSPVSSLRCNVCINSDSWDDCAKSQAPLTCEPDDSHCYRRMEKVVTEFFGQTFKSTTFAKGCATSDKCSTEAIDQCKSSSASGSQQIGIKDVKCDMACCQGNLCN
ncbi:hypothetical protein OS493_001978 [Desmophyllum pertusum]|uniref:UPAR/Ly6 domain-containing protein n=1 Tax=Desmophyllum pertusum TaxID=174260 RepID=A0A9W9Z841_9CNID|nr:hypothetical protein OS493_001978 [Desmophyllum pertusum]